MVAEQKPSTSRAAPESSFLSLALIEPEIRANGPPSAVIRHCPGSRTIKNSTIWYRFADSPTFLACSRCYKDHIEHSKFAESFLRFRSEVGVPLRCRFWVPRMMVMLWPEATTSCDLQHVAEYAQRRSGIADCRAIDGAKPSEDIVWYQPSDQQVPEFISCQACYEDQVLATVFERYFIPTCKKQPESEIWSCDLCHTFVLKVLPLFAALSDWRGFKMMVQYRSPLKACQYQGSDLGEGHWFSTNSLKGRLWICETCYLDRIALTSFDKHFEYVSKDVIGYVKPDGMARCGMSSGALLVAFEMALLNDQFGAFLDAVDTVRNSKSCKKEGIEDGQRHTIYGEDTGFYICQACYIGIVITCELDAFFRPAPWMRGLKHICDMNPATPRFVHYVEKLAEAVDFRDFSVFGRFVRRVAGIPQCPSREALANASWWVCNECAVCPECYEATVSETVLAHCFEFQKPDKVLPRMCSLGSARMRQEFVDACRKGCIADLTKYAAHRSEVYNATVPLLNAMKCAKVSRADLAMSFGVLGVVYSALEERALAEGSRGELPQSEYDRYRVHYGAKSERMTKLMLDIMDEANREDEWRLIESLESRWSDVE